MVPLVGTVRVKVTSSGKNLLSVWSVNTLFKTAGTFLKGGKAYPPNLLQFTLRAS